MVTSAKEADRGEFCLWEMRGRRGNGGKGKERWTVCCVVYACFPAMVDVVAARKRGVRAVTCIYMVHAIIRVKTS